MIKKQRSRTPEHVRNILLCLLALGIVVLFFNLDLVHEGESVFSSSASSKLKFTGAMDRKAFTSKERDRFLKYIRRHEKIIDEIKISASPQDSYHKIGPDSEILFEIQVTMNDGFSFSTPLRRSSRDKLASGILAKLDKDVQAYRQLKKQGRKPQKLINTM